jgi:Na+/melibiose symporter-like transporter
MPAAARPSRDLRLLAGAVALSAAGDLLALVTLALHVHELTGSGLAVSALFATTMVPVVALAPVAGLVVDRVESTRVLAGASLLQAAVAAALVLLSGELAAVLALSALLAAGATVSQPAEFTLVPVVAGDGSAEALTRANGIMETARAAGFTVGPVVAALVAALGDTRAALALTALSFLAIAAAAVLMRARRPAPHAAAGRERATEGAAFLWSDRGLRVVVGATTAALLFISASMTVEVFYVKDVLHAGDAGYAMLWTVWMAGMAAGAARLASRVPPRAMAAGALVALAVQGAGMALQTVWTILPVAALGYLVGGVGHGAKNTLMRIVIQRRVPDRLHGRAFAAYNAARNTAELGALGAGGLLVTALGPRNALVLAGLGPVVAGLAGLLALRRRASRARPGIPTIRMPRGAPDPLID